MRKVLKIMLLLTLVFSFSFKNVVFAEATTYKVLMWQAGTITDGEASSYYNQFKTTFVNAGAEVVETTGEFLTLEDIVGISLLSLYFPQRDITLEEIAVVETYLERGGVLLLYGENNWIQEENERLQALGTAIGVSFTITGNNAAEGYLATLENGGVNSEHPINLNVAKIGYNYIPVVEYEEPATIIISDEAGNPVILEQPLGNGSVLLFVDVNIFDYDTEESDITILFGNIVSYSQDKQDEVEEQNEEAEEEAEEDEGEPLPETSDSVMNFGWVLILGLSLLTLSKDKAKA